jgi:DNA-binding protein H-NS
MGSQNGRPAPPPLVVCCRNGKELTWAGQGEMPSWLKRAVNAGLSVEFYRVGSL